MLHQFKLPADNTLRDFHFLHTGKTKPVNYNPMKKRYFQHGCPGFFSVLLMAVLGLILPAGLQAQTDCDNDTEPPACIAPPNVTDTCFNALNWTNLGNKAQLQSLFGMATATDNCVAFISEMAPNLAAADTNCKKGIIKRTFLAADTSGNTSTCQQTITMLYYQHFSVGIPPDIFGGCAAGQTDPNGNITTSQVSCGINGISFSDQVFQLAGPCLRIERTWLIIDWCTYNPNNPFTEVARRDLNNDGQVGDAFTIVQFGDNYYLDSISPGTLIGPSNNGFRYLQIMECNCNSVEGNVFLDAIPNCTKDGAEANLANWQVVSEAFPSHTKSQAGTDANGNFSVGISHTSSDTLIQVSLISPLNLGAACSPVYYINPDTLTSNAVYTHHFPVRLVDRCPQLVTDIGAPRLRRCFDNNQITVSYGNYGGQTATNAYVDVTLDPLLEVQSSSIPWSTVTGNTYQFNLGNIVPGGAGAFQITVKVNCNAELGQQHCMEAHIYPDTSCTPDLWNGANVEALTVCDGDSVRLILKNTGTGHMQQMQQYLIVEDVIMYFNGNFQLNAGEETEFAMAANGATWHLAADQEPGNPAGNRVYSTLEGCGTNGQGTFTVGVAGQFPPSSPPPAAATYCLANIGAYDPNDKQGFPAGYGAAHYLEPNVPIEYMIRFQNTGTDTAFTVVVRDQLSPLLDMESVRPGISSHPYTFLMDENGAMQFVFNNILLPDSTTNLAGSQGFVKFKVAQNPDLSDGLIIENTANIYFDFNEPIQTNTVQHTIGRAFVVISQQEVFLPGATVRLYPNPFRYETQVEVNGLPEQDWQLHIFDLTGRIVWESRGQNAVPATIRPELTPGLYSWRITSGGRAVSAGRMVRQ
jgi:hypothetical protein